jgi:hypothetical protein
MPVAAGVGDHARELGEDRAPVRQARERVLAQQRLQPRALGDKLVLERLGPGRGLHAREHLAVGERLDQVVLHAATQPGERVLGREPRALDHQDRGAEGHGVGLDRVDHVGADPGVDQRDVGLPLPAALERLVAVGGLEHVVAGLRQHARDPAALGRQGMG